MTGFFEEKAGVKSSTRLMAFLGLCGALVIGIGSVFIDSITLGDALPMVITLLAYSGGVKTFQKFAEK